MPKLWMDGEKLWVMPALMNFKDFDGDQTQLCGALGCAKAGRKYLKLELCNMPIVLPVCWEHAASLARCEREESTYEGKSVAQ